MLLWEHTKQLGCFPFQHFIWLDGCSTQFKSSRTQFFVGRYPSLTSCVAQPLSCQMTWNFFAYSHRKGEVDGAKTLCKREILNGFKFQNVHEVVLYLKVEAKKYHASHNNARRIVNKFYWELKISDINRLCCYNYNTINGSRSG